MKKIILFMLIITALLSLTGCVQKQAADDISQYSDYLQKITYAESYMPTETEFGTYSHIQITYNKK